MKKISIIAALLVSLMGAGQAQAKGSLLMMLAGGCISVSNSCNSTTGDQKADLEVSGAKTEVQVEASGIGNGNGNGESNNNDNGADDNNNNDANTDTNGNNNGDDVTSVK